MSLSADIDFMTDCDGCGDSILEADDTYCSACAGRGKARGERGASDDLTESARLVQNAIYDLRRAGTDEGLLAPLVRARETLLELAPPIEPSPPSQRLVAA